MEMGRIKLIILFFMLSLSTVVSAQSPYSDSVKKIGQKVSNKKSQIVSLQKQMKIIDDSLSAKNAEIESYSQKLEEAHVRIDTLKSDAKPLGEEISRLEIQLKKMVKQYVVSKMDEGQDSKELYTQKMMIKMIQTDLSQLTEKKKENEASDLVIKEAEENLLSIIRTKETLNSLVQELKEKKENLALNLEDTKSVPEVTPAPEVVKIEKKVPKKINKPNYQAMLKMFPEVKGEKLNVAFAPPIHSFTQLEHSPKGVTFTFQDITQVVAPGAGVVVFSGELASYGNVVMIDHGEEIRTVILGNFTPKVKKQDKIQEGELLGYTELDSSKKNTIYFEVRKKNVAQNTVRYLNKNLLKTHI